MANTIEITISKAKTEKLFKTLSAAAGPAMETALEEFRVAASEVIANTIIEDIGLHHPFDAAKADNLKFMKPRTKVEALIEPGNYTIIKVEGKQESEVGGALNRGLIGKDYNLWALHEFGPKSAGGRDLPKGPGVTAIPIVKQTGQPPSSFKASTSTHTSTPYRGKVKEIIKQAEPQIIEALTTLARITGDKFRQTILESVGLREAGSSEELAMFLEGQGISMVNQNVKNLGMYTKGNFDIILARNEKGRFVKSGIDRKLSFKRG